MGSKLDKTYRMALLSHLVHHSSEIEKNEKFLTSEWAQNLLKRSEWLSQAIWCTTANSLAWKKMKNCFAPNGLKTC